MGASLSIGQGVVMIGQVITTGRCHCLQLVIRQTAAVMPTRSRKCIIKLIVRVIHLIYPKNFFQASFIESAVVREFDTLKSKIFDRVRSELFFLSNLFSIFVMPL